MASELVFPYVPELLHMPSKPSAPISYTFVPEPARASGGTLIKKHLVVFLNGLGLPAASWEASLSILHQAPHLSRASYLTYDRYGQGRTTARDPIDSQSGKESGHDYLDVVLDLHEIITSIATTKLGLTEDSLREGGLALTLVCASIGCNIGRLYAQNYPGTTAGLILLDSNIANRDYSQIWPDPDSPSFNRNILGDVTLEEYRVARMKLAAMFDLNVKNTENLDRSNSAALLPHANLPKLVGVGGKGPFIIVVGHDPETFEDMSYEMMGTPKVLSRNLTNFHWAQYNKALLGITDEDFVEGVVIAKGCGHFIQKDDPRFVTEEILKLIERIGL